MTTNVELVKYCPLCGAKNPQRQPFCVECKECDLSMIPVEPIRDAPEPAAQTPVMQPSDVAPPSEIADCIASGDAPAATRTRRVELKSPTSPTCTLVLLADPAIQFQVRDGETAGRTGASEVILHGVPEADAISSRHARFFLRNGQWYVQHVGNTNFIKVDGYEYYGDEEVVIEDGSTVVLSLTAFRVQLGDWGR